jgi:long-chain acyl-CoA synthetase
VDDLLEFCRGRLARHEVPRYVTVHDGPLPRTGSGKLLRRDLRDAAVAAMNHG